MPEINGWNEWSKHVLIELEDNKTEHKETQKILGKIEREIAILKVKSGIWGSLGGLIPVVIAIIVWLVTKG